MYICIPSRQKFNHKINYYENDSGFIYGLYRQFERWINRFIKIRKYNNPKFKFSFYILDITIFNRDNVSKRYREAVSLGVTCIDKYLATLDMTPSRTLGSFILHKDIFDFQNNFSNHYNRSYTSIMVLYKQSTYNSRYRVNQS